MSYFFLLHKQVIQAGMRRSARFAEAEPPAETPAHRARDWAQCGGLAR